MPGDHDVRCVLCVRVGIHGHLRSTLADRISMLLHGGALCFMIHKIGYISAIEMSCRSGRHDCSIKYPECFLFVLRRCYTVGLTCDYGTNIILFSSRRYTSGLTPSRRTFVWPYRLLCFRVNTHSLASYPFGLTRAQHWQLNCSLCVF